MSVTMCQSLLVSGSRRVFQSARWGCVCHHASVSLCRQLRASWCEQRVLGDPSTWCAVSAPGTDPRPLLRSGWPFLPTYRKFKISWNEEGGGGSLSPHNRLVCSIPCTGLAVGCVCSLRCLLFWYTREGTQGLLHARQAQYHLNCTPSPLVCILFLRQGLPHFVLPGLKLEILLPPPPK
jgi:hypothetical protein